LTPKIKVIINKLQLDEAIRACCLEGNMTQHLLHYHVKRAERKFLSMKDDLEARIGMVVSVIVN